MKVNFYHFPAPRIDRNKTLYNLISCQMYLWNTETLFQAVRKNIKVKILLKIHSVVKNIPIIFPR